LQGSTHASVYKWLENKRREMKRKRIIEMGWFFRRIKLTSALKN
jgi:rRNA processing protein Krr1/Pno1